MINFDSQSLAQKNRIRIAVAFFYFSQGIAFASWASRIPTIKTVLQLNEAQLGTLLLLLPVGQLCTMALSGKLVARHGSKTVLEYASLVYGLILLSISFSTTFIHLAIALFFFGVAGNMNNIAVNTQGVEAEKIFGKSIMSSFHGAWSIAGFSGALIGMLMLGLHSSTTVHFSLIFVLMVVQWLINHHYLIPDQKEKALNAKVNSKTAKGSFFANLDRNLLQLGIIGFLSMATEGAMFDWSGVYFQKIVKAPAGLVILGYASFMVMMATGRFIGDYFIGRYGKQRILQTSGLLMFSGLTLAVIFPNLIICTFAFMLVGLGVACNVPTVYSVAGKNPNVSPGIALATVSSISFLGFLIGPPLIGYIAHIFDLRYSYGLYATFGMIMFLMAGKMKVFKEK